MLCVFFFFNDTATTEIYTLSLHDALPISGRRWAPSGGAGTAGALAGARVLPGARGHRERHHGRPGPGPRILTRLAECGDRKSTRLNSSHANISYAVFCLKKKKTTHPSIQA